MLMSTAAVETSAGFISCREHMLYKMYTLPVHRETFGWKHPLNSFFFFVGEETAALSSYEAVFVLHRSVSPWADFKK